jgi:hypothetical protein
MSFRGTTANEWSDCGLSCMFNSTAGTVNGMHNGMHNACTPDMHHANTNPMFPVATAYSWLPGIRICHCTTGVVLCGRSDRICSAQHHTSDKHLMPSTTEVSAKISAEQQQHMQLHNPPTFGEHHTPSTALSIRWQHAACCRHHGQFHHSDALHDAPIRPILAPCLGKALHVTIIPIARHLLFENISGPTKSS